MDLDHRDALPRPVPDPVEALEPRVCLPPRPRVVLRPPHRVAGAGASGSRGPRVQVHSLSPGAPVSPPGSIQCPPTTATSLLGLFEGTPAFPGWASPRLGLPRLQAEVRGELHPPGPRGEKVVVRPLRVRQDGIPSPKESSCLRAAPPDAQGEDATPTARPPNKSRGWRLKSILADAPPPAHSRPDQNPTGVLSLALASSPGAGPDRRAEPSPRTQGPKVHPAAHLFGQPGRPDLPRPREPPPPALEADPGTRRALPVPQLHAAKDAQRPRPRGNRAGPAPDLERPAQRDRQREPLSARSRNAWPLRLP